MSTPSQYNPPNIGPHDESVAAVVEIDWSKPIVVVYPDGRERHARLFPGADFQPDVGGQYHVDFCDDDPDILFFNSDGSGWGYAEGRGPTVRNVPPITTPDQSALIAQLVEALEQAAIWHEDQDKAISKQPNANVGDNGWRRMEHQAQRDEIRTALAAARGEG